MSLIDTWTDETAERAMHLLRVAESIVRYYRRHGVMQAGDNAIRPVTVDRWLTDAAEFNNQQRRDAENAEAEDDGQGEARAVADRRQVAVAVRR